MTYESLNHFYLFYFRHMDCKVCSRPKASNFNHYGATGICGSCRGFFMRATQSDLYKTFEKHGKKCVINAHDRTSCKKCRFDKCLEVGMKISYVRTVQEKARKSELVAPMERPKTIEGFVEKQGLEATYDTHWESVFACTYDCIHDLYAIDGLIKTSCGFLEHVCQPHYYVNPEEFFRVKNKVEWFVYKKLVTLLTVKDGVQEDLEILYQTNFDKMQTFRHVLVFADNYYQIEPFVEFGQRRRNSSLQINEIMQYHDYYGNKNFKLDYDQFFSSPWAPNITIEMEHANIFKHTLNWYNYAQNGGKTTQIDKCLMILVQLILLYNVDKSMERLLRNPKAIKNLQAQYAKLLHKYLVSKHTRPVANALFGKGLMLIHDLQRAHDLYQQRLKLM